MAGALSAVLACSGPASVEAPSGSAEAVGVEDGAEGSGGIHGQAESSAKSMTGTHDPASSSPVKLSLLSLTRVLGAEAVPELIRERLVQGQAVLSISDFQDLSLHEQSTVAAAVKEALAAYDQRARRQRAGTSPDSRTAFALKGFLDALGRR